MFALFVVTNKENTTEKLYFFYTPFFEHGWLFYPLYLVQQKHTFDPRDSFL